MSNFELKISKDFSKTPGPRFIREGDFSGEEFRNTLLYPKIKNAISEGKKLIINLDGAAGYATSFLEESFGGLIRVENLNFGDIEKALEIISIEEPYLEENIIKYLREAQDEKEKE